MNKGKNKKIKKVQNSIAILRYKDVSQKEEKESKIREKV